MAQEKYHRERRDKAAMPGFARAMIVLGVVQIVFSMSLHAMEYVDQLLLMIVGVVALVGAVVAAFAWDASRAFRNAIRGFLIFVPLAVIGFGVFSTVYASFYNPDSDPFYNLELYGSIAVQFTQIILVFMLPTLVAAASYGARFDRAVLSVAAILNAAAVAFLTYYVSGWMGMFDFTMDLPVVKLLYVLFAFVFAGLTLVPAIGNDPDRSLRTKKAS